jgi:hypothetical protein
MPTGFKRLNIYSITGLDLICNTFGSGLTLQKNGIFHVIKAVWSLKCYQVSPSAEQLRQRE